MQSPSTLSHAVGTLNDWIRGIEVAMLTTVEPDGSLRSRPLLARPSDPHGDLWFVARAHSRVIWSLQRLPKVNLSYLDPIHDRFVSVSGTAYTLRDPARAAEIWHRDYAEWFDGPDDADLRLIRIVVESAQGWDGPSGKMMPIEGFLDRD